MSVNRATRNFGAPQEEIIEILRQAEGNHGGFEVHVNLGKLKGKPLEYTRMMAERGMESKVKIYNIQVSLWKGTDSSFDYAGFEDEKEAHARFEALVKEYGLAELTSTK